MKPSSIKINNKTFGIFATLFALLAFAANSVLCRLALGQQTIDPASFTVIRMLSGAITLLLVLVAVKGSGQVKLKQVFTIQSWRPWLASLMLFCYAIFFSFAYMELDTASGALILFAMVQFFMIGFSLFKGHRFSLWEYLGVVISFSGFVLLMLPSATQPSLSGFVMMSVAGIAWAIYTLEGKQSKEPIVNTAENFLRCLPLTGLLLLLTVWDGQITWQGVFLAIISGAVASGLGYTVWYVALRQLSITQAAISQLSVPLIAALGGVVLINEALTLELILSGGLILSGIMLVAFTKPK
jgi:drug/metabolite transporter (DMT)-like permease